MRPNADILGEPQRVVDDEGIVRDAMVINWQNVDEKQIFEKLRKAKRI